MRARDKSLKNTHPKVAVSWTVTSGPDKVLQARGTDSAPKGGHDKKLFAGIGKGGATASAACDKTVTAIKS